MRLESDAIPLHHGGLKYLFTFLIQIPIHHNHLPRFMTSNEMEPIPLIMNKQQTQEWLEMIYYCLYFYIK